MRQLYHIGVRNTTAIAKKMPPVKGWRHIMRFGELWVNQILSKSGRDFQTFRRWRKSAQNGIIPAASEDEAPPSRIGAAKNVAQIGLPDEQEGRT